MIMYDAFNTPALAPVTLTDAEGVELITSMIGECPVNVRAFPGREGGDNVTVFWTVTTHGEVGTVWEHTRENAFNVPMTDGDRVVEALRQFITDPPSYEQYDRDTEYATGE